MSPVPARARDHDDGASSCPALAAAARDVLRVASPQSCSRCHTVAMGIKAHPPPTLSPVGWRSRRTPSGSGRTARARARTTGSSPCAPTWAQPFLERGQSARGARRQPASSWDILSPRSVADAQAGSLAPSAPLYVAERSTAVRSATRAATRPKRASPTTPTSVVDAGRRHCLHRTPGLRRHVPAALRRRHDHRLGERDPVGAQERGRVSTPSHRSPSRTVRATAACAASASIPAGGSLSARGAGARSAHRGLTRCRRRRGCCGSRGSSGV
jgi:hypothetical protein